MTKKTVEVLCADDDADDRFMIAEAWKESLIVNKIQFVEDGEDLMDYLLNQGKYTDQETYSMPGLILLDLNMPRKSGREALAEIKANPKLKKIPIVVLTTSKTESDVLSTYELGVSSFITKPITLDGLVNVMKSLSKYWFEIVELPVGSRQ
ncbi:MAG: response regulator [Prolixibacteraceae bacterium]